MFWRSSLLIGAAGLVIAIGVALNAKNSFRSETTVLYRDTIQTKENEPQSQRAARLGPKLKELLFARPKLEQVIVEYNLFPDKVRRSMIDAIEAMQQAMNFRTRSTDSFVISFTYEDPDIAQQVTARLTGLMIDEYQRQTLDTATLTRDFLQRELAETNRHVDEASRALATFLAHNPQFQWGLNDSPYAPTSSQGAGRERTPGGRIAAPLAPAVAQDPALSQLQRELARVDAQLAPAPVAGSSAGAAAPSLPASSSDAQKQRDAAAATLAAAQAALVERLITVTPAHPDAISAKAKVEAARQNLAAAEAALQLVRVGAAPALASGSATPLDPAERAELLRQRDNLLRQMAARRAELAPSGATPAARAAEPRPGSESQAKKAPDVVELETEWHRLRLELDRARDQLSLIQKNTHAAEISADATAKQSQNEMQILEPAYRPMRPDRGRGRIFFAGAAVALFLALGYAAARVLLNDIVLDEGDIAALGGPPMLVAVPHLSEQVRPPAPSGVPPSTERDSSVPISVRPTPTPAAGRSAFRPDPSYRGPIVCPPIEAPEVDDPDPIDTITLDLVSSEDLEPPRNDRGFTTTIPFGTLLPLPSRRGAPPPPATVAPSLEATRAAVALTVVHRGLLVKAVLDDPEVEVIGAEVDPRGEDAPAGILHAAPAALAALRVLRHRIEQKRGAGGAFVVSVVSPGPGEGKTLLAAQLATTLAESARARVVLVEGNLERPAVAAALGLRLREGAGLSAQVRQRMNGRERPWGVVHVSASLAVLAEPGAQAVYPAALHSTHFQSALAALRRTYDYVVIDGPSILGSGDANVIEAVSDGVLMVARAAETRASALSRSIQQIGALRVLGVVLNGVVQPEPHLSMKDAA
jgi:Mrp family chromosome partitioning ATPase